MVRDHDNTSLAAIISPGFEGASVGICGFLANNAASSKNNHNVTDMTAVESCGGAQSLPRFRLGGFWRTTRRAGRQSALRGGCGSESESILNCQNIRGHSLFTVPDERRARRRPMLLRHPVRFDAVACN
jgi:hypothetical protein